MTVITHGVDSVQLDKILREARSISTDGGDGSAGFDFYTCLVLVGEFEQDVEDAIKFASIFTLIGDTPSMSEGLLERAMIKYGVTVDEIIEFEESLDDPELEFESERVENRNAYLAARARRVSHQHAAQGIFYP